LDVGTVEMILHASPATVTPLALSEMKRSAYSENCSELKVQPRQVTATAQAFCGGRHCSIHRPLSQGSDRIGWTKWAVTSIRERLLSLAELDQRREAILKSLTERNLLTDALKSAVAGLRRSPRWRMFFTLPAQTPHPRHHRQGAWLEPLADALFNRQSTAEPDREAATLSTRKKAWPMRPPPWRAPATFSPERISDDARARAKLARFVLEQKPW